MKTKIFFFAALLIGSLVIFSSCESKSGRRVREDAKASTQKVDTLTFTPEKIAATNLIKEYIPYPQYDGGTGIRVNFFIGIQHKGKTYEVECSDVIFFRENVTQETAEKDPRISKLILTHYLASNTPKEFIDVMVINREVVKLSRRAAFFTNDVFYPSEVIWERE